jgi:two-component system chemotaxis sensor kinase CheA
MRRFKVSTSSSDNDLLDLFTFHVAREQVQLAPLGLGYGFHDGAPGAPMARTPPERDPGYGFFEQAPGAPDGMPAPALATAAAPGPVPPRPAASVEPGKPGQRPPTRAPCASRWRRSTS